MASINSIRFSTEGWQLREESSGQRVWLNPDLREVLSLHYFAVHPDLVANLSDLEILRQHAIESIEPRNGELVEIATEKLGNVEALYQIMKYPIYEDGRGRVYLAAFTLPFQMFSFVIKVQCQELGTTGVREAFILSRLMNEGEIDVSKLKPDEEGKLPEDMRLLISKITDEVAYDMQFPNHPLSRVRSHIRQIRATIQIDEDVQNARAFNIQS